MYYLCKYYKTHEPYFNIEYEIGAHNLHEMEMPKPQKQPTDYEVPVMTRVTTTTSVCMKYQELFNPVLIKASRIEIVGALGEGAHENGRSYDDF